MTTAVEASQMTLYPAIDIRAGRVVRLRQGDYAQQTDYGEDPLALARRYREAGADWLHLVDLDAARDGGYTLQALLRQVVDETGLQVQTGGGVRTVGDVQSLLDAGAARVVIGSLAVREPRRVCAWLQRFGPERITIALDTRCVDGRWLLPVQGWTAGSGQQLQPLLARYVEAGLRHLLCTDIARDGMLIGPNLLLYGMLIADHPQISLQASGGVRDLADVVSLRELGVAGMVTGRALLEGKLDLAAALSC
jgi:phosphoribosylformimino-5-aminoimidazole carboxamide ribotide isomerase